jgi:hypothetical protein
MLLKSEIFVVLGRELSSPCCCRCQCAEKNPNKRVTPAEKVRGASGRTHGAHIVKESICSVNPIGSRLFEQSVLLYFIKSRSKVLCNVS